MKFKEYLLVTFSLLAPSWSMAEECTHLWTADLTTDALTPKGLSGDTHAGYALFGFRPERDLSFVIRGEYPNARFFSLESYRSRFLNQHDAILDTEIEPLAGYSSPFETGIYRPGQYYDVEVLSESAAPRFSTNVLRLPSALLVQAIMLRIYDPSQKMSLKELPRIYAVDAKTGAARRCPSKVNIPFYLDFPQIVGALAPRADELKFGKSGSVSGGNTAIPGYMYTLTQLNPNDVGLVRFKAPTARYASLCIQNFLENETRACISDRAMKVDDNGFVFIAFSENPAVLATAAARGWNVLPYSRAKRQKMFGIVYRNILPENQPPYEGAFAPVGQVCLNQDFVSGTCHIAP